MYRPVEALAQSFSRMKARDYATFLQVAEIKGNSYANTVYADADGNIAYFHPQFVARRDDRFDFKKPVDGSNPDVDWRGEHQLQELPHVLNPSDGWIANTNNWPYSAAGNSSPKAIDYPRYMDMVGENPRGLQARRVLANREDFTLQSLVTAAYDPYLPAFARLIPRLVASYDQTSTTDPLRAELTEQIELLRKWNYCWRSDSIATSLAVYWGEQFVSKLETPLTATGAIFSALEKGISSASSRDNLLALASACAELRERFGSWRIPWGEVNRFQRLDGKVLTQFDDAKPSIPVPFTSGLWGSLAVFIARHCDQKRRYGIAGNSFIAAVEFGPQVRARAASMGGASGHRDSPHFDDQSSCCISGQLREVYFHSSELSGHIERIYRPGDRGESPRRLG
jgi:acyl-homoserine-lactone acylase